LQRLVSYIRRHHWGLLATALVLVSGGAYAAGAIPGPGGEIDACYAKSGDQKGALRLLVKGDCTRHERPITWNQQGTQGLPGQDGGVGDTGATGKTGPPGSAAASLLTSHEHNNDAFTQTLFTPVSGLGPATNTSESVVTEPSPAVPVVARDLFGQYASDNGANTAGSIRTFTLRVNDADTALSCTITRPAASCADTSDAVTIPAGSSLAIKFFQGGSSVSSGDIDVSFRATPP
jgi:hypothetical protein